MPRPKPPEVLIPRSVRMSHSQWAAFDALGGSAWLRSRIGKLNMTGIAKRERNRRIQAALRMGEPVKDIAKRFKVERTTVWRVAGARVNPDA